MKKNLLVFYFILSVILMFVISSGSAIGFEAGNDERVVQIMKKSCSTIGCHAGSFPPMNLNLEGDKYKAALLDRPSQGKPELLLVDRSRPEQSYVLMKLKGEEGITGGRMPLGRAPLSQRDYKTIEEWVLNKNKHGVSDIIREVSPTERKDSMESSTRPPFWGTTLINLPTPQVQDKGLFLFRISHRYYPAVKDGYDDFYGLDGPAVIMIGLGYALTDNFSLSLARSNRFKEIEIGLKWAFLEQGGKEKFPLSMALNFGTGLITQSNISINKKNSLATLQLIISRQMNNRLSFLLVPSFASNTSRFSDTKEGTFSLGTGMRYMIFSDLSILAEWIPVLAGHGSESSGWGLGLEWKIGGHIFQLFFLNSVGITSSQYLPGGDFSLNDLEFRLGFNIFRLL